MKSLSNRKGIMESSDVVDEFTTLIYEVFLIKFKLNEFIGAVK